jgi:hypothetical protein
LKRSRSGIRRRKRKERGAEKDARKRPPLSSFLLLWL